MTVLLALVFNFSKTFGQTYGSLAGLVALQLWTVFSALAILYGIAVAAQLEAVRAGVPEAQDHSKDESPSARAIDAVARFRPKHARSRLQDQPRFASASPGRWGRAANSAVCRGRRDVSSTCTREPSSRSSGSPSLVVLVLLLGYLAWHVLSWILIAILLAAALNPAVEAFERRGLGRLRGREHRLRRRAARLDPHRRSGHSAARDSR